MPSPIKESSSSSQPISMDSLCSCWLSISDEISSYFSVHELLELTAAHQAWKQKIPHTARQQKILTTETNSAINEDANESVTVLIWLLESLYSSTSVKLSCVLSSLLLVASVGQGESSNIQKFYWQIVNISTLSV